MNNKIFITGERHTGKSTLIKKIWKFLTETFPDIIITGFITVLEQNDENKRILRFITVDTKENLILAEGKDNNKMCADAGAFDKAATMIKNMKSSGKMLIIDELGYLESESIRFQREVLELINEASFSIIVVRKMKTFFLDQIRSLNKSILIEVTEENRDNLEGTVKKHILKNYLENYKK